MLFGFLVEEDTFYCMNHLLHVLVFHAFPTNEMVLLFSLVQSMVLKLLDSFGFTAKL